MKPQADYFWVGVFIPAFIESNSSIEKAINNKIDVYFSFVENKYLDFNKYIIESVCFDKKPFYSGSKLFVDI